MPRDTNGTYSLAPLNPVVRGDPIVIDWANPTMDDIEAALTDSLSRSGKGPMLAPLTLLNSTPANVLHAASKGYVDGAMGSYVPLTSYTAADVLTKIKTVDGPGSGLDADLLDGQSGAYYLDLANATGVLTVNKGGFPEAPQDGKQYARKSAAWAEIVIPPSGIPEAPIDGSQYARQNAAWAMVSIPTYPITIAKGGTSATDAATARTNLGLGGAALLADPVPLTNGGTGATSAPAARGNLGLGTLGPVSGFRNRIINPTGRVQQRGTATITAGTTFLADRWRTSIGGGPASKATFGADPADSLGSPNTKCAMYAITNTVQASLAAGDYSGFQQLIENVNVEDFRWGNALAKTTTLSFYAHGSAAMTIAAVVRILGTPQERSFVVAVALTTTAQRFTFTIPAITSVGTPHATTSAYVEFYGAVGSTFITPTPGAWATGTYLGISGMSNLLATMSTYFRVSEVQLEVGSTATDFEIRPYATELNLCERYYQIGSIVAFGYAAAGVVAGAFVQFRQTMRAAPAVTATNTYAANVGTTSTVTGAVPTGVQLQRSTTVTGGTTFADNWTADAELS